MTDNCGKYGKYGQSRFVIDPGSKTIMKEKTLSEEYDKKCSCIQCLSRRRTYLKMVIHNLSKHEGWEIAIERHVTELEIIGEKLIGF